eukprot:4645727-Pyramimonas_sp.AAC.1
MQRNTLSYTYTAEQSRAHLYNAVQCHAQRCETLRSSTMRCNASQLKSCQNKAMSSTLNKLNSSGCQIDVVHAHSKHGFSKSRKFDVLCNSDQHKSWQLKRIAAMPHVTNASASFSIM